MDRRQFKTDEVIVEEGAAGNEFFVIESGSCHCFKRQQQGLQPCSDSGSFLPTHARTTLDLVARRSWRHWCAEELR
eukprot:1964726-Rhodomonas_salina.3